MDRLAELEVFTQIADAGSLTRAADALGLSVSGVSRHLTSLENRLGVRLVQRTTRQLFLTGEGSVSPRAPGKSSPASTRLKPASVRFQQNRAAPSASAPRLPFPNCI
ncbi:helix-turn-helix domain-containing protein [Pannonibacter phragmitetus]|uniref:helix-turn-helix domain-containing protein n=1 Tax=Pannonibacter phragmitetus TaxID=121719 RepID=UPI003D2EF777